jgi:hypothetical protein
VDCSSPFYSKPSLPVLNPTNGSWWIVQILTEVGPEVSTNPLVGLECKWFLELFRKDLNNPPTPVGGISDFL